MNSKITFIIVIVAVALLSFYGGVMYKSQNNVKIDQAQFKSQTVKKNAGGQNGGARGGELLSKDDGSIVLKSVSGKEIKDITIKITDTTTFTKIIDAYKSDLNIGNKIVANGAFGPDGIMTAKSIEINQSSPKKTSN